MFSILTVESLLAKPPREVYCRSQACIVSTLLMFLWPQFLPGQANDLRGNPINSFPVTKTADAFHNEKTTAGFSFKIYFPVDLDRYFPIDEALASRLSETPSVKAPEHLQINVTRTVCTPLKIHLKTRGSVITVSGGVVECEVEIIPESLLEPRSHEVRFEFAKINELFRNLEAREDAPVAEAKFSVSVWTSREAKLEEEQRPEKEKRKRERDREEEQQRQAANFRLWILKGVGITLAFVLIIGLVIFRYGKWLLPTVTVTVTPGQNVQIRRAVKARRGEEFSEPGTILGTIWARDRNGKTARIKVETFVAGDGDERKSEQNTRIAAQTHHEFGDGGNPNMPGADNLRLDVLVSVGASVPPGTYIADCTNGSVKVKVARKKL